MWFTGTGDRHREVSYTGDTVREKGTSLAYTGAPTSEVWIRLQETLAPPLPTVGEVCLPHPPWWWAWPHDPLWLVEGSQTPWCTNVLNTPGRFA